MAGRLPQVARLPSLQSCCWNLATCFTIAKIQLTSLLSIAVAVDYVSHLATTAGYCLLKVSVKVWQVHSESNSY
jgi:hypothetical protein